MHRWDVVFVKADCSLVYMVRKSSILRHLGSVIVHRRQEIQRKIRACLGLG
jgi:hypothetical protein